LTDNPNSDSFPAAIAPMKKPELERAYIIPKV
jgi:hypothetical protein